MFQINSSCFLDLKIGDIQINVHSFVDLLMKQNSYEELPIIQITIKQLDYTLAKNLRDNKTEINFTLGSNDNDIEKYNFLIVDFDVEKDKNSKELEYTLYGILNVTGFTNQIATKSFPNKSVLDIIKSDIENIEVDTEKDILVPSTDDSQTWIQHNIPEKDFIDRIMSHCYISDDTFPLYAISAKKKLRFIDYKTEMSKTPEYTFSTLDITKQKTILYKNFRIETDRALMSKLLGEGRKVTTLDMVQHKTVYDELPSDSQETLTENVNFPIKIDNKNCHTNYYIAQNLNLKKNMELKKLNIILTVENRILKDTELPVLSLVKLEPDNNSDEKINTMFSGKYLMTSKSLYLNKKGVSQEVVLNRIEL